VQQPQNLSEFQALAREALDDVTYAYFSSGAEDQITLRDNHAAYERIKLLPRVLVDVTTRDTVVEVLGTKLQYPIIIAPMAFHKLAHPDGEIGTMQAAEHCGLAMTVSTYATTSLGDVVANTSGDHFFQLYFHNRESAQDLVTQAAQAGYRAIMLTVDLAAFGKREAHRRQGPLPDLDLPNLHSTQAYQRWRQHKPTASIQDFLRDQIYDVLDWQTVSWLRAQTTLPIVLKGILRPDDARRAVDHGAAGVIVSNHGGRQLDTVPATIDALPPIVEAVGSQIDVLVDGGIRRGTDVLKALALGAQAVMLGQPVIWGLAYKGKAGVIEVLEMLQEEFDIAMALCGCANIADITAGLVQRSR